MRLLIVAVAIAAGLGGCVKKSDSEAADEASNHGRYVGIGTYYAGRLWQKMVGADNVKDAAAAKLVDDDQIIVVVDSRTGEVRQCGNMTGYCTGLNPWLKPLSAAQAAPVKLTVHEDQLTNEPIKVQTHTSLSVPHDRAASKADTSDNAASSSAPSGRD